VLLTNTNRTPAVAEDPLTVVPDTQVGRLHAPLAVPILIVAPDWKFDPKIVTAALVVIA
jgi:hypothetical protein